MLFVQLTSGAKSSQSQDVPSGDGWWTATWTTTNPCGRIGLRVETHPSSRCHPDPFLLLPSAGSSIECVPDRRRYGRGNDHEHDQPDHGSTTRPDSTLRYFIGTLPLGENLRRICRLATDHGSCVGSSRSCSANWWIFAAG
jgi:hypothetical protein